MEGDKGEKIAIIDMDSVLFACAWGNKIPDKDNIGKFLRDEKGRLVYEEKTESEIGESIDKTLHTILQETIATHYIIYVKGKNTAKHRYRINPDYKANRPKQTPSWWEFAKNYVIEVWKALPVDDIEVDDACLITKLNLPNSFIVAIDKDLLNLEGEHYNWRKKEWVNTTAEEAEEDFWKDMIVGQPGDNIRGIPKMGEVAANKLLKYSKDYPITVFETYIQVFGLDKAIHEFYKNYSCLKIKDAFEGFTIPEKETYNNIYTETEETKNIEEDLFSNL